MTPTVLASNVLDLKEGRREENLQHYFLNIS